MKPNSNWDLLAVLFWRSHDQLNLDIHLRFSQLLTKHNEPSYLIIQPILKQ